MKSGPLRFSDFLEYRDYLIDLLENGEITKKEFLLSNCELIRQIGVEPFCIVDSYEKGIFNYHYYNVMAKYYKMKADEYHELGKQRDFLSARNRCFNYYQEKEKETFKLLEFLKFRDMVAYYIPMNSKSLNNMIFEIVLLDHGRAVFHSKSEELRQKLLEAGVFLEEKRPSVIESYINKKY